MARHVRGFTIPGMNRRATSLAALAALFALVSSLLVGATVLPASAELRTLSTTYDCEAEGETGSSAVRVKVDVPDRVRAGVRVDARRITFRIVVPDALVQSMRDRGVEAVSATGTARYRVGAMRVPIRNLTVPRTDVPASGEMVIRGRGRASGFTIDEPGRYAVKVPRRIAADVTGYVGPFSATVDMTCGLAQGAPARLSLLRVVR